MIFRVINRFWSFTIIPGLTQNESYYLNKAKILIKNPAYTILEIEKEAFFENTAKKEIAAFKAIEHHLLYKKGFFW